MIQLKAKHNAAAPHKLSVTGTAETTLLKDAHNNGARDFKFKSDIYGHETVKAELIRLQHDKCCFCESKISAISYGDVEHYRPKGGWVQHDEDINKPGYYWLAYEWSNLMLSCQICNQRHKKNYFPLRNPNSRAKSHNDNVANEQPLFINPSTENPEAHISFVDEIPKAVEGSERGKETIIKLGLDRGLLNEKRMDKLKPVKMLYEYVVNTGYASAELRAKSILMLQNLVKENSEYSSMFKCFFLKNPIPNS